MLMADFLQATLSAVAGASLSGALARAFISRSLRSLDDAVSRINDIRADLARISARLDTIDRLQDLIHSLDRKVAALEAESHGINGKSKHPLGLYRDT